MEKEIYRNLYTEPIWDSCSNNNFSKNISLKAAGDIDFYSTLMKANSGNVNITGENLYFLTSNNYANSTSTTKKKLINFRIPLNKSKTTSSRSQISQLPVKLVEIICQLNRKMIQFLLGQSLII